MNHDELPKIIKGIERHIGALRAVQGGFDTSGLTLSRAIWELGTMCSLSGKALKDMSMAMDRMQEKPKPVPVITPKPKAAHPEQQP